MILDTSAVIAILRSEPASDRLLAAMLGAHERRISTATVLETCIVMHARYGDAGEREVDVFLQRLRVDVVPFTADHLHLARSAYRRFGKGRHPAALNFGDCLSYALAVALDEPLLFTGDDFRRTDVRPAA